MWSGHLACTKGMCDRPTVYRAKHDSEDSAEQSERKCGKITLINLISSTLVSHLTLSAQDTKSNPEVSRAYSKEELKIVHYLSASIYKWIKLTTLLFHFIHHIVSKLQNKFQTNALEDKSIIQLHRKCRTFSLLKNSSKVYKGKHYDRSGKEFVAEPTNRYPHTKLALASNFYLQ